MKKSNFLILFICILGIILRVLFYSYNRFLWTDEAALALNVLHVDNYFLPLQWGQAAPAFFMYLSKLVYNLFPYKELALRFFPLVFSICSIFVFNKLVNKYCHKLMTKITAVSVFAFSYPLVYYAQEFKQYSLDVLCFLLILLSYDSLKNLNSKKQLVALSLVYSFALFVSFPAFFAIFIIFLNLLLFNLEQFKKKAYMLIPILSCGLLYIALCHSQITSADLHTYWQSGFLTFDIKHDINVITSLFKYIFVAGWAIIFFFISMFMCIKNKLYNEKYTLIFLPICLAIILSGFKIYPLQSRVSLYLFPLLIILTVKFMDYINFKNKIIEKIFSGILCILILFPLCFYTNNMVIKKSVWIEDFVTPLNLALKDAGEKDTIIIADGGQYLYEYYKNFAEIKQKVIVEQAFSDESSYIKNLNGYQKGRIYYIIYAHNRNKLERLKTIYNWAKTKNNFNFVYDKGMNAMIRFGL